MFFPLDKKALNAIEACRKDHLNHIAVLRKSLEPMSDSALLEVGRRSRNPCNPAFHEAVWQEVRRRILCVPVTTAVPRGSSTPLNP